MADFNRVPFTDEPQLYKSQAYPLEAVGKGKVMPSPFTARQTIKYTGVIYSGSYRMVTSLNLKEPRSETTRRAGRALAERLARAYPSISVSRNDYPAEPHIAGFYVTVAKVLRKLIELGSVEAVASYYAPHIGEDEIKDAVAYAQEFLQIASDPKDPEDRAWADAQLARLSEFEPYDWGDIDPDTIGEPII